MNPVIFLIVLRRLNTVFLLDNPLLIYYITNIKNLTFKILKSRQFKI